MGGASRCTRRAMYRTDVSGSLRWRHRGLLSRPRRLRTDGGGRFHEAALDSAQGLLWPEERIGGEDVVGGLASTQRRHLELSGRLLGLEGERRLAERLAEPLGLTGLEHHRARDRWREGRTRRERGQTVLRLLLSLDPGRADRLLAAGYTAGLWGRPWRIDPATGRRRPVPSRDPPTTFGVPCSPAAS